MAPPLLMSMLQRRRWGLSLAQTMSVATRAAEDATDVSRRIICIGALGLKTWPTERLTELPLTLQECRGRTTLGPP